MTAGREGTTGRLEHYRCRKDCPGWHKGCHASCERYKRYREVIETIKRQQDGERDYINHVSRARENFRGRKNRCL